MVAVSGVLRWERDLTSALYMPRDIAYDPAVETERAAVIHFSDAPLPKPWDSAPQQYIDEIQPTCDTRPDGGEECTRRDLWLGLYTKFRADVDRVCRPLRAAATEAFDASDPVQQARPA